MGKSKEDFLNLNRIEWWKFPLTWPPGSMIRRTKSPTNQFNILPCSLRKEMKELPGNTRWADQSRGRSGSNNDSIHLLEKKRNRVLFYFYTVCGELETNDWGKEEREWICGITSLQAERKIYDDDLKGSIGRAGVMINTRKTSILSARWTALFRLSLAKKSCWTDTKRKEI